MQDISIIGIIVTVVVLVILLFMAIGYVKAPPDMAYIISGVKKKSKVVIAEIQKQTGYCFIFNTNQGEQIGEITISVRNKSVQEVMEEILRPT